MKHRKVKLLHSEHPLLLVFDPSLVFPPILKATLRRAGFEVDIVAFQQVEMAVFWLTGEMDREKGKNIHSHLRGTPILLSDSQPVRLSVSTSQSMNASASWTGSTSNRVPRKSSRLQLQQKKGMTRAGMSCTGDTSSHTYLNQLWLKRSSSE